MLIWMRIFIFSCLVCLSCQVGIYAGPYLPDEPGKTFVYSGQTVFGEDSKPASEIIQVMEPVKDPDSSEMLVVHKISVTVMGKNQIKYKYFSVKADGIYLIAESETLDQTIKKFETPSMYIPIPPEEQKTWQMNRPGVAVKYHIEKVSEIVNAMGVDFDTVHIKGSGTTEKNMLKASIIKEKWINKEFGVIKSVSKQMVGNSTAVVTLILDQTKP